MNPDALITWSFINENLALYVLFALLAFAFFVIAFVGTSEKVNRWRYPIVALFFIAALGTCYVSLGELLGRAKPIGVMSWDKPNVERAKVEGMYFIHKKAIYLLLMYDGLVAPRYYQFPWSTELAEKLKRAKSNERMREHQGTFLENPFEHSWEDRDFPDVWEMPWPKRPPKEEPTHDVIDLDTIDA